ncbi:MFS transporter [Streptomyces purpurogeneiscleroticus]|uniref:MFS transporter n=1 Tax=Streptomyces purpurogeneiscleroticus TaxID=68259 RepID=UPI001CBFFAE3|nr:MFS transporter [Streptomyces purpurogeneiscleroticus]MBZ4018337.1 MFS transporter [Streptomyces purpurogeneiscleroticus]
MTAVLATYRTVLATTGPVLPAVSFLGRLPTAMCQLGSVLLVTETSGSLATAGVAGGALAAGQTVAGPLIGRLADRHGQRPVVLAACWANALAVTALVLAALSHVATLPLALLGLLAGLTVPQVGPLARTRLVALVRRSGADERTVNAALSWEGTLDEVSFVLGPALVGVAAAVAHPAVALALAALLLATCGSAFALHRTAGVTAPEARTVRTGRGRRHAEAREARRTARRDRPRIPASAHALRVSMALQGAMFGASQAGITALTERLGAPGHAGLVYAAMGVMSAVAGLSLVLVPARIGLPARWRAAAVGLTVLSVPLLFVGSLGALYAVVVVLGVAFAPHLITIFALTERLVPARRMAESMAFLTSSVVGGQALALALSGRLAESYGPPAAFAVAVAAAVLVLCLALTVRFRTRPESAGAALSVRPAAEAPSGSAPPG